MEAASPEDAARAARYCEAFFADIEETDGFGREITERLVPIGYLACTVEVERPLRPDPRPGRRRPAHGLPVVTRTLESLQLCFEGAVPAVIATAAADGTPNVTYLSRVHLVDHERVALSNQFFSKTARNLAENPRASVLLIEPWTYEQFRLRLVYERTERRGPVFERLRADIDALAALEGMEDVFKLQSADIYRVLDIELVPSVAVRPEDAGDGARTAIEGPQAAALGRAGRTPVPGQGPRHRPQRHRRRPWPSSSATSTPSCSLLDEDGRRLYTIASRGYDVEGVGSEVTVGEGLIGMAAARCRPLRVGNLRQMSKYSRSVRQSYEDERRHRPEPADPRTRPARRGEPAGRTGDGLRRAGRRPHGREPRPGRLHER